MDVQDFLDRCQLSDDFNDDYNLEVKLVDSCNLLNLHPVQEIETEDFAQGVQTPVPKIDIETQVKVDVANVSVEAKVDVVDSAAQIEEEKVTENVPEVPKKKEENNPVARKKKTKEAKKQVTFIAEDLP